MAVTLRGAPTFNLDGYVARCGGVSLSEFPWDDVPRYPLSADTLRALRYMQDIESHTIIYLRELLATRAVEDPDVAVFLACWVYEETLHGLAIARFLEASGQPLPPRPRPHGREPWGQRLQAAAIALISRVWPHFCAAHMTWGAINEMTALTSYRRLAAVAGHPVLSRLLERIALDEARHFYFYYRQAQIRLERPGAARITRLLVNGFWGPVGTGVQPLRERLFLTTYLFSGAEGGAAARQIDEPIKRLPGLAGARLMEAWMQRTAAARRESRR